MEQAPGDRPTEPQSGRQFLILDGMAGVLLLLFLTQALLTLITLVSVLESDGGEGQDFFIYLPVLTLGFPVALAAGFVMFLRSVFSKSLAAGPAPRWFTRTGVITILQAPATLVLAIVLGAILELARR